MMHRLHKPLGMLTLFGFGFISANATADAAKYENKYPDEVPYIDIYSYPEYGNVQDSNAEMTQIWESSAEIKNETYSAKPHTIVKENGKVKYALVEVYGAGYEIPEPFEDLVLINCENPRQSYIERGDRERISLKDSMAIGDNLDYFDERWSDHIPRDAVGKLFQLYCR